ncbi:MAG TPA: hypothetical protein VMH27_03510 [Puia sp.]|nr:hypothetical protein [Puia sp.]
MQRITILLFAGLLGCPLARGQNAVSSLHSSLYDALNAPSAKSVVSSSQAAAASGNMPFHPGSQAAGLPANPAGGSPASIGAGALRPGTQPSRNVTPCSSCNLFTLTYEIPGFVLLDRGVLSTYVHQQQALTLASLQTAKSFEDSTARTNSVNALQKLLDQYDNVLQSLNSQGCNIPDLSTFHPIQIHADVRFNDPVSGAVKLIPAGAGGLVNVYTLFNSANSSGLAANYIDSNPVKATATIYLK